MKSTINPDAVKAVSERQILEFGGRVCEWLPLIEQSVMRPREQIVARALILNAMLMIHFKAPIPVIKRWIEYHYLAEHLSDAEGALLQLRNDQITAQQDIDLYWNIEALWALLWVGNLIDEMPFDRCIEDHMAALCPDLQLNEGPQKFADGMRMRSPNDVFQMLDLHFRLHWWTRDGQLNGYSTEPVRLDIIMERRKALEWVMDPESNWDDVSLDT